MNSFIFLVQQDYLKLQQNVENVIYTFSGL